MLLVRRLSKSVHCCQRIELASMQHPPPLPVRLNRHLRRSFVWHGTGRLLGVCLLAVATLGAEAAEPRLQEIRSALEHFTRSIERLDGRQAIVFLPRDKISRAPDEALIMEDMRIETEFKVDFIHDRTALNDNRTWYYREISPEQFSNEGLLSRFNGETSFSLHTTPGREPLPADAPALPKFLPNVPYVLVIGPRDQTKGKHCVWEFAGLPCPGPNLTLAAIVNADDARIVQKRKVDGVDCIEIAATALEYDIVAALDPNASWLPRSYHATRKGKGFKYEQIVSEFQQFPVAGSDERIWFPTKGRRSIDMGDMILRLDLILMDLHVNSPMVKEDFEIDIESLPPGVQVQKPGGTSHTGGRKDLFLEMDKAVDETTHYMRSVIQKSREKALPESQPVRVSTPRNGLVPAAIAAVSIVLLLAGIRLALKHSRAS